jgi:integrase/recombinase XerD
VVVGDRVDGYLRACEARGLRAETIAYRRLYLTHFAGWLLDRGVSDVRQVNEGMIAEYVRELRAHRYRRRRDAPWRALEPRTIAQRIEIIAAFFEWLCRERVLFANPMSAFAGRRLPKALPVRVPSERDVVLLLDAARATTAVGKRNRAILELLYSTGMRRAELEGLDLSDLDLAAGAVLIRSGKGGRARVVPMGDAASEKLLDYIQNARPDFLRRAGITALFLASTTGRRLSKQGIWLMMRELSRAAGFDRPVTPHQLRHACATHMLRAGCDVRHVQAMLGHAKIETTEIYTRVAIRDLASVHARTHPRCRRPQRP